MRLMSSVAGKAMVGAVRAVFALARALGPDRSAVVGSWITRSLGPLMPQHRIGRANLAAAFPEKTQAERDAILKQAWDSLGQLGAEYAHLSTLFDYDHDHPERAARVEIVGIEHFEALRDDSKPGIIFSAHLANWELAAIAAARYGLDVTAVFRPPNDPAVADVIHEIRSGTMGGLAASRPGAAFSMQGALDGGGHLGMLIDQHFTRGVVVHFMGQKALTNPVLAKFARRFECPVHGVRVIRLPGHRFRLELTPPLDLPRGPDGLIDVPAATAAMTAVIEGWVREHPGQWLWMHRRWRPKVIAQMEAQGAASALPPAACRLNAT
jgi:KDO2-lipid IV(A) lauroyltransferase